MIAPDTILRAIDERRCLRTTKLLSPGEELVSSANFPGLYSGRFDGNEAAFLRLIYDQLPAVFHAATAEQREALRSFMQTVLRNGRMHKEDFVHRFVFEFWDDLWTNQQPRIALSERYFLGQTFSSQTPFVRDIVKRVYGGYEHVPDIIGISPGPGSALYIVEIKNEPLDDRALGQILRYYQVVRTICDRFRSSCDVRRVVPILVVPSGDLNFWHSIPYYFREVIEIFYWRSSVAGSLQLVDGKQSLRDSARGRLSYAPGA